MEKNKKNKKIQLSIKIYKKDSIGMYDYKSDYSEINSTNYEITNNSYIIRKENNIVIRKQNSSYDEQTDGEILFYVRKSFKTGNFEIINPVRILMEKNEYNINSLNTRLWYSVNSIEEINDNNNDNEDYILNQNDIIKLGRIKYEIIKLNINSNNNFIQFDNQNDYNISSINKNKGSIFNINIKKNQYKITENKKQKIVKNKCNKNSNIKNNILNDSNKIDEIEINKTDQDSDNEEESCRICLGVESSKDNPKICLCSCNAYSHYECLKQYLSTKLEISENFKGNVKTYICDKFNCDICRKPYPLRFRIHEYNKIYELVNLNMPSELDYIILESLDYIKGNKNLKRINIILLINDEITIGRNDMNDMIDPDISVSRNHAILKYNRENGTLIVENLSQKYGTLILIEDNIKMKEKNIHFQVGKSYIVANSFENDKNNINSDTQNNDFE